MRIVVLVKQVTDPLLGVAELEVAPGGQRIVGSGHTPAVVNGYDEQAMEAALRIREAVDDCEIIALSAGPDFELEVLQRSLAEADDLVLVTDGSLDTPDPHHLADVLGAAIRHIGGVDLVLGGRQASDWDHGQVPLETAERLGWPCVTLARSVSIEGSRVVVERVLDDGHQVMECDLPAVVTVTSELGELRYPTMPVRLQARRRRPNHLALMDLELGPPDSPAWELLGLSLADETRDCRFIEADDAAEAGRRLAATLLSAGIIGTPGGP